MKKYIYTYSIITVITLFLVACSTKRNNFVSRNMHALATRDNILYNGGIALDKGITDLKSQYKDNFWEILPVERMQVAEESFLPGETKKNADFERSEGKATKAIQKHSMNIGGSEKNPQMDEAYLMLGKTRYYDQRFIPALEAFNYVLYKYPTSDKINIVKIWREKTNMRLENDAMAVVNLNKLLKEIKFKDQVYADANATLAQAFLNLEEKDSAVAKLNLALEYTKSNEEKARYRFILGQIYDSQNKKEEAFAKYQEVIDMKRKAARQYVVQSQARQALQFDYKTGDTLAFKEKFDKLLNDRENRPYLDVLNYQLGMFYDKQKSIKNAKKYYNASLKTNSTDQYLTASTYRSLAEINFNDAKYVTAGKYYDSTLAQLKPRTREFNLISKKRANLDDVIKFEGIAQKNDSILKVSSMSSADKEKYYSDYIENLKKEDIKIKERVEKTIKEGKDNADASKNGEQKEAVSAKKPAVDNSMNSISSGIASSFYFYNPSTVAFGKIEFKKKWGDRSLADNWRTVSEKVEDSNQQNNNSTDPKMANVLDKPNERYTTAFYLKKLPTNSKEIDGLTKDRNFAYYQLGVIYKEKFKEYSRAADKLEHLLSYNPEERLVLPSMYNLYKIYEIIDPAKAKTMKDRIIQQYPDSRYAQILSNSSSGNLAISSPETIYNTLYKDYEKGMFREVLPKTETAISQFTGEEMVSKFDLLKANLLGKLKGVAEYKKGLNYVALTYPNSDEGKQAEKFLTTRVPYLESLTFNSEEVSSWKILYNADNLEDKNIKTLLEKLNKFVKDRTADKFTISTDIYTLERNFIVLHGIRTKDLAKDLVQILKDYKDYKIANPATVISSENYKVVQVKKNIDEYISGDWLNKPIVPVERKLISENPAEPKPELNLPKKALNSPASKQQSAKNLSPPGGGIDSEDAMPSKSQMGQPVLETEPKRK